MPAVAVDSGRRQRVWFWRAATMTAGLLAMAPTLSFPFGLDQAVFSVGARMVLDGAVFYRDVIDVKPPLIFYTYAAIYALLGDSPLVVHVVDLLVQFAVAALLYRTTKRYGTEEWGLVSAFLYLFIYSALGYHNIAQTESIGGALAFVAFVLSFSSRRPGSAALMGVLAGVAALFKTTLIVALPAVILVELVVRRGGRRSWLNALVASAGAAGVILIHLASIAAVGVWDEFMVVQQFTREFVQIHLHPFDLFRALTGTMVAALGETISIPIVIAACVAVARSVRGGRAEHAYWHEPLQIASVWAIVMFASIIVEGRFHPYHFIRLLPYAAMLAAFPIARLIGRSVNTGAPDRYRLLVGIAAATLALVTLPAARWAWYALPSLQLAVGDRAGYERYYDRAPHGYSVTEQNRIGAYLSARGAGDGDVFAASGMASNIYNAARINPSIPLLHSSFFAAPYAPDEWRALVRQSLLSRPPRFLVISDDVHSDLNSTDVTSRQALHAVPGIDSLIRVRYTVAKRTRWYEVLERKGG